MIFGSNFGSNFGDPESCLTSLECESSGEQIRVAFTPNLQGWYGVYVDSRLQTQRYCNAGEAVVLWVSSDHGVSRQVISVIFSGAGPCNNKNAARHYDYQTSKRVTLDWSFKPEVMGSFDSAGNSNLTNWFLSGVGWYHLSPFEGSRCRGYLTVNPSTFGNGWYSVAVKRQGYQLAEGTGAPDTEVILSGSNGSGIYGSVFITSGATNETLFIRYPKQMRVYRSTTNPPTSVVASVPFRGIAEGTWTEPSDLVAGQTYYYKLQAQSDTDELSNASSGLAVTIPAPPSPVGSVEYVSGNATTGIALKFDPSITAGVSLSAYIQRPNEDYTNWNDAYVGATFDSSLNGVILSGINPSGVTNVCIRATKDNKEEKKGSSINLEMVSGEYMAPRPNVPTITNVTASGLSISASVAYDPTRQLGTATKANLYLKAFNGSYPATPNGTASLTYDGGVYTATVTAIAPAKGWYWVKAVAATESDVESLTGSESKVFASSNVIESTPTIDGQATRG